MSGLGQMVSIEDSYRDSVHISSPSKRKLLEMYTCNQFNRQFHAIECYEFKSLVYTIAAIQCLRLFKIKARPALTFEQASKTQDGKCSLDITITALQTMSIHF